MAEKLKMRERLGSAAMGVFRASEAIGAGIIFGLLVKFAIGVAVIGLTPPVALAAYGAALALDVALETSAGAVTGVRRAATGTAGGHGGH